jgi:hypothetical protein
MGQRCCRPAVLEDKNVDATPPLPSSAAPVIPAPGYRVTAQPPLRVLAEEDCSEDDEFWDAGSVVSFYTVMEMPFFEGDFGFDDDELEGFEGPNRFGQEFGDEILSENGGGVALNEDQEVNRVKELLREKRHLDAYNALVALGPNSMAACAQHGIDIGSLEEDVAAITEALYALEDEKHWMVAKERPLRVLYRHFKSTTIHGLKLSMTFPHPPSHIVAIANEWDLIPTWNKYVLDAVKLAEPGNYECFVYGAQWMIKPFRHLDAIVRARGFDLAETHRCLIILVNDVDADALPSDHRPVPEESYMGSRRKVNVLPKSCIVLKPLPAQAADGDKNGRDLTEAHLMVYLDPHIPFVPGFLINFVLGILAPYIARQMNKVLNKAFADMEGEYSQRLAQRPELYERINRRVMTFAEQSEHSLLVQNDSF